MSRRVMKDTAFRAHLLRSRALEIGLSGRSMRPYLLDGECVTLIPVSAPRVGDVCAYVSEPSNQLIVHRVVSLGEGVALLKGDHAAESECVAVSRLLGTAVLARTGKGAMDMTQCYLVRMTLARLSLLSQRMHPATENRTAWRTLRFRAVCKAVDFVAAVLRSVQRWRAVRTRQLGC